MGFEPVESGFCLLTFRAPQIHYRAREKSRLVAYASSKQADTPVFTSFRALSPTLSVFKQGGQC